VNLGNVILTVTAMLGAALLIIESYEKPVRRLSSTRTDAQLCREVKEEVYIQAEAGMITEEQAAAIAERCFNTFVKGAN